MMPSDNPEVAYLQGVVTGLVARLDRAVDRIDQLERLVQRHNRTFTIIHRGLHNTTDPDGPGV